MRRISVFFIVTVFMAPSLFAAKKFKVAFVDLDRVYKEYKSLRDAKAELQRYLNEWERTRDSLKSIVDSVKREYEKQKPMMTDEQRLRKEEEIKNLENEYKNFWVEVWGENGRLEQKMKELIEPLTDKVGETIRKIAEDMDYDLVLNISSEAVLYGSPKDDITQMVLDELNKEYVAQNPQEMPALEPLVAVFPLKELDNPSRQRDLGRKLQGFFATAIDATPQFKALPTGRVITEMQNEGITQNEFLSEDACRSVAKNLGADFFLFGEVSKTGDQVKINVYIYDLRHDKKIATAQDTAPDKDVELQAKATALARQLASQYKTGS